jgi:hypothetical protein
VVEEYALVRLRRRERELGARGAGVRYDVLDVVRRRAKPPRTPRRRASSLSPRRWPGSSGTA